MFTAEQYKVVPVANNYDLSTHDTLMTLDSINMKGFHHCTFLMQFASIAVASPLVYVYSGATDGALTSALTFNYAFGGAAAGSEDCDVLAAWSTSAALTVTFGTYPNSLLVIEVQADIMDVANGENWLTINLTDPTSGCTGNVTVMAILVPRYTGNRSATALE
ncbi:MAG: hypothetical protein ABIJ57_17295 [Pseudomonadota bacterium]